MEHLDALLEELLQILHHEGSAGTEYAQRTLMCMRRNMAIARESGASQEELLDVLREQYKELFPPKGGLSEFYRWSEDFQERERLNREVEALLAEIRRVLDRET